MSYDYEYIVRQKKRSNRRKKCHVKLKKCHSWSLTFIFQLLTLQLTHNENEKLTLLRSL
jgi:D-alanyl-lipoteichoic acid acyltransferase DltB (MBOAT superfamily)